MRVDHAEVELAGDQEDDRADGRHAREPAGATLGGLEQSVDTMQAMMRSAPPHTEQVSMSMLNTRLGRCAQVIATQNL